MNMPNKRYVKISALVFFFALALCIASLVGNAVWGQEENTDEAPPVLEIECGGRRDDFPRLAADSLKPTWTLCFSHRIDLDSLCGKAFFDYTTDDGKKVRIEAEATDTPQPRPFDPCDRSNDIYEECEGKPKDYNPCMGLYDNDDIEYYFTPKESLPRDTAYIMNFEPGITFYEPGIKLFSKSHVTSKPLQTHSWETFRPLRVDLLKTDALSNESILNNPDREVYILFSNPVQLSRTIRAITVDNGYNTRALYEKYPIHTNAEKDGEELCDYGRTIELPGPFKEGKEYTIRIAETLKDVYGQPINYSTFTFETGTRLSWQLQVEAARKRDAKRNAQYFREQINVK